MKVSALVAEFVGAFALVFVGVLAIASGELSLLGNALAYGLTVAVMVSATMAISGGHLNPAVTLAMFFRRQIDLSNAVAYIVVQCFGAVVAGLLAQQFVDVQGLVAGTPQLGEGIAAGPALLLEAVLTFFLVFVIFGTAIDERSHDVGGLFIGLTIALGVLAGGPLTGAAMNPARHLGSALAGGDPTQLGQIWIYWIGPVLGGVIAGAVYGIFMQPKKRR